MKLIIILVLTAFLKISHGSYPLSPTNTNYYPNPAGNYNNYNPELKSQQYKSPTINLSSYQPPPSFRTNFLPSSTPSPSTYSNPSAGSFLPGVLPSRSPSTTTSSFSILPSSSTTSFSNNNFSSGPSFNYYSTPPPPSNNHQQWASTVHPTIPRWSIPQQSPSWPKIMSQSQNNVVIAGGPPSENKFGSSASSNSHQSDEFLKAFIYSPTTTTTKPSASSISFSTSLAGSGAVGEATRIRSTNIGNSSTFSTGINTNYGINNSQETGQYWKSVSDGSNASNGGGAIIRGGPRGQQSIPSYTPSLSPQLYGGRPRGQIQNTETSQMWSTPVFSTSTNSIWGNDGPWKGLPESPTQIPRTKYPNQSGLQSSTKSSYSSSSHSSSYSTKTENQTESKTNKGSGEKGTNSSTKNSFTDSNGVSASSPSFPSILSKESLSLPLVNSGDPESHKTPERSPRKYNQGKELLFYSEDISNDISEKVEENDSRSFTPKFEDIAKTGSFSWKGSDGKLYEIRYTADDLGIHFEDNDSPTIAQSNLERSSVFSNLNLQQQPITIVISDDELYINELQQEPLDSLKQPRLKLVPHEEQDSSSSNTILVQELASNSLFSSSIPTENENQLSNSYLIEESDREIGPEETLEPENDNNESKKIQIQSQPEIPEVVISFGTGTSSTSPHFFPLNDIKDNKEQIISSSPSVSTPYSYYEYKPINSGVKNPLLDSLTPSSFSSSTYQSHGQMKNAIRNKNPNNNKKISYAIRHRSKSRPNSAYYYYSPNSRSQMRHQHATQSQKYNSNLRSLNNPKNGRKGTTKKGNPLQQMFSTIAASSVPSTTAGNMRGHNYNYNNYDRNNAHNNYKMNRRVYKR